MIAALSDAGCLVVVTVTDPSEAVIAAAAGADALCVQGSEAGGHRGTFANDSATGEGHRLIPLMGHVAAVTDLPLIAAGGIMGPGQVEVALGAGAVAVQCGTAFLRCRESGANPLYKDALVDPRYTATAMTRAFSGRWAAAWSTGSSSTTPMRLATRRSTTPPGRCGPPPPAGATRGG